MKMKLLAWVFLGACAQGLHAAENVTAAAGFAMPTIENGAGARAIALGSTYVGIAEGSDSLLWNPAGLGALSDPEIAEHHNAALLDSTQDIAVLGLPLGDGNGLGLSLNYENDGTFDGRDTSGNQVGDYTASAYGGSLGWGMSVPGGLSLGVALKFNQENLAGTDLDAFAGDVGVLWNINSMLTFGAAYNNLGPNVDGWQLDQGLSAGLSSYFYRSENSQWLAAVSESALHDGDSSTHAGLEYTLYHFVSLRAGYAVDDSGSDAGTSDLLGWSFGGGVLINKLSVDYAFVPLSDLGAMQRVSLAYDFGCPCLAAPVAQAAAPSKDLVLALDDADFEPLFLVGDEERLSSAAQDRLYQALTQVSGVPGATLTVDGASDDLSPADPAGRYGLGARRFILVRDFMKKRMPLAEVGGGAAQDAAHQASGGIFQAVLR